MIRGSCHDMHLGPSCQTHNVVQERAGPISFAISQLLTSRLLLALQAHDSSLMTLEDFKERLQELLAPVKAAAAMAAYNNAMAYGPQGLAERKSNINIPLLGLEDFQERLHELVAPAV